MKQMYKLGLLAMGLFVLVNFSSGQVFITELADPNNNLGARYIELYNAGASAVDFTEGSGWRIDKYTNESATVSQTLNLTGSIPAGGFYIVATGAADADFEAVYGIAPDQFDGADNDVAGSNGDDNLELYDGAGSLIDQFGVPGADGTGTNHEFEDGRAERKETVTTGNATWDVNEWNIDSDQPSGDGAIDAPGGFDPGAWIGEPAPTTTIVQFESTLLEAFEDDGTISLILTITNEDVEATTVDVIISTDVTSTADASDIDNYTTQQVTFPSSDASNQSVTITLSDDAIVEGTEVLYFELTNAAGGNSAELGTNVIFELTIEDNDFNPEPTNHVASFAAVANGATTIDLTWSDNDGAQAAEGFLIKSSTGGFESILDPTDGSPEADGEGVINVASGAGAYTFTGLDPQTEYFFKIYPYTNSGAEIDFKVDGTVPEANATTEVFVVPQIFISEVADPQDVFGARFVEFYNAGTESVDMSQFYLARQSNGGSISSFQLSGIVAAGETFVVANNSTDFDGSFGVTADQYNTGISSNGDDGYFVYLGGDHTAGSLFDSYGVLDVDGTDEDWEFLDSRAVRNSNILNPNPTWTVSEWTVSFPETVATTDGLFTPGTHFACTPPSSQASAINFTAVGENVITVNWTSGDGDGVVVVAKEAGAVDADPESGTTYTANAAFSTGDELGTGNFVVFAGAGTSVQVTGLTQGTEYHFAVYEYYDSDKCYNTEALIGSETTVTPNDETTDILNPDTQITSQTISSLADTEVEAIEVFAFAIFDEGTDGQSTFIETMQIESNDGNSVDWTTTLGGAYLDDGTTTYPLTIGTDVLTLDLSGTPYEVANGTIEEFSLFIWLSTSVEDGGSLEFTIPTGHSFTANSSGSQFLESIESRVAGSVHSIEVVATAFEVDAPSTVGTLTDFSLSAAAVDENGNVDTGARTISLSASSLPSEAALTSTTGLSTQAMTDGVYEWTDLQVDAIGSYTLTVDDDGSALTESVEVTAANLETGPALLLISEIAVGPTAGEFIEIYNASESAIALDNYYITDATFSGDGAYYYNIVTGTLAGGGGFADWHARFPEGATIAPGEVQTISLAGSEDFFATYGIDPTYELYEDGASADGIPDMREALTGSINNQGGLTDGGEIVVLYYWDGASDLVTDIDYVMWGDQAEAIDKTGISIDGPDGDTDASSYQDDLATSSQALIAASAHSTGGNSWSRIDFTEGTETKTGGNGVDGHNEMTENLGETFAENSANPGEIIEPGSPLITLTTDGFNGNFGFVVSGSTSDPSMYSISSADLTGDVTITPPAGFEIAGTMAFDGTIYTNSSPWVLTSVEGVVSQDVYVRFAPSVADGASYSGDITHVSTGAETKTVAVSGIEGVFDEAPNLSGIVFNEILPDPNFTGTEGYDTDGSGGANTEDEFIEFQNTGESPVDISGWQLWDENNGNFFTFPAETTLGAGNYVGVMAAVQSGGTLPTPSEGNLAFAVGSGMSLSNGGENVALYNPNAGEYIQIKFGDGEADADLGASLSGASLVGIIENWGIDDDGSSLVRETPGSLTIVVHQDIDGAAAASFAEPTIDPNAPLISIDDALFDPVFENTLVSTESVVRTYTVSGTNLSADIVITASTGFSISTDGSTFSSTLSLSPTGDAIAETTISVKFSPTEFGSLEGSITHTTTGGIDNTLNVAGAGIDESTIYFNGFSLCDDIEGFTVQDVSGGETWDCTGFGETGDAVRMNGFSGVNEDWLISPAIDLTSIDAAELTFVSDRSSDAEGPELEVYVSADYTNDATTATWTLLPATYDTDSGFDTWTSSGELNLPTGGVIYIGFKYTSTADFHASWTIDNFVVTETLPFFTANVNALGDFDRVNVGEVSINKSFILDGFGLTADATVTPPAQFEVSLSDAFTSIGTSASPLTITQTDGVIDGVEVFVRFSPTMEGAASGDVTVSTTGFDDITLSVEGFGEADDPVLGLKDVTINIYPNPASSSFSVVNDGNQRIDVKLYGMDGSVMTMKQSGNDYDISHLSSGMYILKLTNESGEEMTRRIIKE